MKGLFAVLAAAAVGPAFVSAQSRTHCVCQTGPQTPNAGPLHASNYATEAACKRWGGPAYTENFPLYTQDDNVEFCTDYTQPASISPLSCGTATSMAPMVLQIAGTQVKGKGKREEHQQKAPPTSEPSMYDDSYPTKRPVNKSVKRTELEGVKIMNKLQPEYDMTSNRLNMHSMTTAYGNGAGIMPLTRHNVPFIKPIRVLKMRGALNFALWIGSSYATYKCILRDAYMPHGAHVSARQGYLHPHSESLARRCGDYGELQGCCLDEQDQSPDPKYYQCRVNQHCIAPDARCVIFDDGTADCGCQNARHGSAC
ncbi:hypothetical protein TI39_contig800g00001 [Zymoseptoria brevis]|uniref:Uncharacterized protein n=1 Tax=Zymoseptoria brevis TaxID=1047168 RepID=A0A0F4GFH3_9PEZI|nr:hypothetical protein TI39_contig800g00001 [Zymoseptoria brevis]